jgi:hypothetical protein
MGDDNWNPADETFRVRLRAEAMRRLSGLCIESGDLPDVETALASMAGLDPLFLLPALLDLEAHAESATTRDTAHVLLGAYNNHLPRSAGTSESVAGSSLPDEHPLDYDWRFADDTRGELADLLLRPDATPVLLLGCPTLAFDERVANVSRILVDDNPGIPSITDRPQLTHLRRDLIEDPSCTAGYGAKTVVGDPPFYPDAMTAYAYAAAVGLRVDGQAHLVAPSSWARPTAAADTAQFIIEAASYGLELTSHARDRARYRTPKFEHMAYARAGYLGIPETWRTADVLTFTLITPCSVPAPSLESDRAQWHEVVAAGVRWRINPTRAAVSSAVDALGEERQLTTVSRRDPRRVGVNVFTDDNRAYRSSNPSLLTHVLHVTDDPDPLAALARRLGAPLTTQQMRVARATVHRIRASAGA